MRPAGPAIVLGVRDGNLWLADDVGQPFVVPLTHPGLRARTKTARNDLAGAVATAEKGVPSAAERVPGFIRCFAQTRGRQAVLVVTAATSNGLSKGTCFQLAIRALSGPA